MQMTSAMTSTGKIIQSTPQDFFDFLNGIFRFDLDVCALPENTKCENFYTPKEDGLSQKWWGGYGAILPTEKTSSIGYARHRRSMSRITTDLWSCFFRPERIRSGSSSMFTTRHISGSLTAGSGSETTQRQLRSRVWLQFM